MCSPEEMNVAGRKVLPIVCIVACQGKDSLWTPCSCTCLFHDADSNTLPTLAHSPTQHNQGLISRLHDASKMAISFQSITRRATHCIGCTSNRCLPFQIDRASAVTSARKICDRYLPMFLAYIQRVQANALLPGALQCGLALCSFLSDTILLQGCVHASPATPSGKVNPQHYWST